jgi:hypothetical protein
MMRLTFRLLALLLLSSPAISYFKYDRKIGAAKVSGQHYLVVEEPIWQRALPNLSDLRLYAAVFPT